MNEKLIVGIADMKLLQNEGELITYALGSCIGICLHDPLLRLSSLVHIMLPSNAEGGKANIYKYADSGILEALNQMALRGGSRFRIVAKIAGGAKMFELSGGALGSIGQRNFESVRTVLRRENIRLVAEDVGGTIARTMSCDPATGQVFIRSYGQPEKIL